ncbi:MAG: four helix bundle protein [Fuerstiella sp.]|nr:four helix bundle protein [Fuerstiella sp.]
MDRRGEDLEDRLLDFAVRVGKVVDALPDTRLARHIAGQLVRSGTWSAPNYAEACAAESKRDFIHKLGIALKELRESRSWIKLIVKAGVLPAARISPLHDEVQQLCNIVGKSSSPQKPINRRQSQPLPKVTRRATKLLHFTLRISTFSMVLTRLRRSATYTRTHPPQEQQDQ